MSDPHELDAYRFPRQLRPGCQHIAGMCRCDAPFWLRASTPAEEARITRMQAAFTGLVIECGDE